MKQIYHMMLFLTIAILLILFIYPGLPLNANNNTPIKKSNNSERNSLENLKLSQYYLSFVYIIDDNWTEGNYPWLIKGDGTAGNPHIIQDVIIDGDGTRNCILIENCIQYFIIRNCEVYNSGTYDSGIRLLYTNNGKIINNHVYQNGYGIELKYSSNNNVTDNIVEDNTYCGIRNYAIPEQGRNADNNVIVKNDISKVNGHGIEIFKGHNINITENTIKNTGTAIQVQGIYANNYINSINPVKNEIDSSYIGISLRMINNSEIRDNVIQNCEYNGIQAQYCDNLKFINNEAINNTQNGFWFGYCNNINCSLIKSQNNTEYGIYLAECNDIEIRQSIIEYNELSGLFSLRYVDNSEFIENEIVNNKEHGVFFQQGSDYNIFLKNNISYNNIDAINLKNNCHENEILNNTIEQNKNMGISLANCEDNKIAGNSIQNNLNNGIHLSSSHNNTILDNNIYSNNEGIILEQSNDNVIAENRIRYNNLNGINILNSNKTIISENIVKYSNLDGIFIDNCHENIIFSNIINYNDDYGIHLNYSNNNFIIRNTLIGNLLCIYEEFSQGNIREDNFCDCHPLLNLDINIIQEYFTAEIFIISIYLYNSNNEGVNSATFQILWNGTIVHADNITNFGFGHYNISLIPLLVSPGEPPILLNMTIITPGYYKLNYSLYIMVDPESVNKDKDNNNIEISNGSDKKDIQSASGNGSIEALTVPALIISGVAGLSVIGILFFLKKRALI